MHVSIVVPHAQWEPHRGGGGTAEWSENSLGAAVSALVSGRLRELGCEPHLIFMPEQPLDPGAMPFRCSGRHSKGTSCNRYNRGLRWCTSEAVRLAGDGGVALSFHMGRGRPGWSGPLCLVNHAPLAHRWAEAYLAEWSSTIGGGRGVWEMPRDAPLFPRNPHFVRRGPRGGAVLIEMGNAASANDCALFDGYQNTPGLGLELVADAAAQATAAILS